MKKSMIVVTILAASLAIAAPFEQLDVAVPGFSINGVELTSTAADLNAVDGLTNSVANLNKANASAANLTAGTALPAVDGDAVTNLFGSKPIFTPYTQIGSGTTNMQWITPSRGVYVINTTLVGVTNRLAAPGALAFSRVILMNNGTNPIVIDASNSYDTNTVSLGQFHAIEVYGYSASYWKTIGALMR